VALTRARRCGAREGSRSWAGLCVLGWRSIIPTTLNKRGGHRDSRELGLDLSVSRLRVYGRPSSRKTSGSRVPLAAKYFQERAGVREKIIQRFPDYHYPKPRGVKAGRVIRDGALRRQTSSGSGKTGPTSSPTCDGQQSRRDVRVGRLHEHLKMGFHAHGKRMSRDIADSGRPECTHQGRDA